MSRIRQLSIKGIRNFDDEDRSPTIRFYRPLTLILGPNGTGKTTIIECLRYALSGEFPPDSDKGKAFVQDPTLKKISTMQIRGNVKLEYVDRKGALRTVSRTIQTSRTEKGLNLKTLDSTLSTTDRRTGEVTSIPSKCVDIDREVMSGIGVSKAIVNYVLFCHQDDSNWPFETGQKLKERFDEIFDTTRYNKALDSIRKLVKEQVNVIKILAVEKGALNATLMETKSKQNKLKDREETKEEILRKIDESMKALEPINERLCKIHEIEAEYYKWRSEDDKKKLQYKNAMELIMSLKENIKETYSGSTESLKNEIDSYEEILSKKDREIEALEGELRDATEKETEIAKLISDRTVNVGTLQQQIQDRDKKIAERNNTITNMLDTWNMNETIESNTREEDAVKLIIRLEDKLRLKEQEMEAERVEQEQEQEQLERKVNVLRAEKATIESQLAHNESELVKIKGEIRTNRSLLRQSRAMEQRMNEVDSNLAEANKKLAELSQTSEIDSLKRQIQELTAGEEENERKFNDADKEITLLREHSALQMKLESSQADLMEKEREVQFLREKHQDTLKVLLGKTEFPENKMTETMEEVQMILNKRVQNLRNEVEKVQNETMKLQISVDHKKKELDNKVKEIEREKNELSLHCDHYTNYREVLQLHSKKIKDLEDKRGMYAYQGSTYKEYIKKVSKESCCPLCHRGFENSRDATILVNELRNDMSDHPERLGSCERELLSQRKKYDSLLKLQPVVEKIENFERVEATKMRQKIQEDTKHLAALSQKLKRLQESMAEPERKLSNCKNMIGDMALWDRYSNEIEAINASVAELQDELRTAGLKSNKTIEEAQAEHSELQKILKDTRQEIKALQTTLDSRNEKLSRAADNRASLLEQQVRVHKEMQDIKQAKENLEALLSKETTVANNVHSFEERMREIEDKLQTAIENLDSAKQDFREKQENGRKWLRERSKSFDQLNSLHEEVKLLLKLKIDEQLRSTEEELQSAKSKSIQLKTERINRETKISKMNQDKASHDLRKRDLADNLKLREKEVEAEALKLSRQAIRDKLAGENPAAVEKEREQLCKSRGDKEREINIARGKEEAIGAEIAQIKLELQQPQFRNARANYKNKCIEWTVAQQVRTDLHTYSKVLDKAMTQFHEERMNTVNQILKKLWALIYTGTDTTSIAIKAEATGMNNMDARRQFKYRLVQVKHGVEINMVGRCSAGQKVLASIILRLALAETFCEHCGVLALDEPTTNLDDDNAKSLANALHKYVTLRKNQRNFQLIVITHDDNFIPKLSQLSSNNSYYELYRFQDGISGIKCVKMDEPYSYRDNNENDSSDGESKIKKEQISVKRSTVASAALDSRKRKKKSFIE